MIRDGASQTALALNGSDKTLQLSGADTYSGGTIVSAGTLIAASNVALGSGSLNVNPGTGATAAVQFTSAAANLGALQMTTSSNATALVQFLTPTATVGSLQMSLVSGSSATVEWMSPTATVGSVQNTSTAGSAFVVLGNSASNTATTLVLGGNNASSTFDGAIRDLSATASGAIGSIDKTGAGSWVLGGTNTYTGSTTVDLGRWCWASTEERPDGEHPSQRHESDARRRRLQLAGPTSGAASQTVASLTLNPGTSAIQAGASGTGLTLSLHGITREPGSAIDFTLPITGGISTTSGSA